MRPPKFWPNSDILNISLPTLDEAKAAFLGEVRRLALRAEHGEELASLIEFARSPLPEEEDPPERDEALEAALAKRMADDLALRAESKALAASAAFKKPPPCLPRRFTVWPQERRALTASGEPLDFGLAMEAARAGWRERTSTSMRLRAPGSARPGEPVTAAAAPRPRRGFRVDLRRKTVTGPDGSLVAGGYPMVMALLHRDVEIDRPRGRRRP